MVKCIVVDDEQEAIELIRDHVKSSKELKLMETFTNPLDALIFMETNMPDLIFVDVRLSPMTGLEFMESLRNRHGTNIPDFIYTSACTAFALPAFECGAADYLLKPVGIKRFKIAMDRFLSRKLQRTIPQLQSHDYFFAEVSNAKQKINFKEISYIESAGNYVNVLGDNNLKATVYNSLNAMKEMLPVHEFIRVHKSYVVSIDHIFAIKGNELTLKRGDKLVSVPIGVTYKSITLKRLKIKD